ncbi:MAG TPA: MFS transporter [Pirellulales bacterium]|nr:MFS transporter [Pirellulales bacterium]
MQRATDPAEKRAGASGWVKCWSWLPDFFRPAPPAAPITDPEKIRAGFAWYRPQILLWTTIGYGTFYFVRKNYSFCMPLLEKQLGLSKTNLGLILTLHSVLYGISKFANGIVGDRADGRKFMTFGLAASAVVNVFFGFSTALPALIIFWMLNGLFQGMGYPPCARLLAHWFSPQELAIKMSYWNASHSLGGAGILILCSVLVTVTGNGPNEPGDWRICFFVPAAIALVVAGALWMWLRDTPESVGLPELPETHVAAPSTENAQTPQEFRAFLWERVFSDKYIWIVSAANFFVYVLRYAIYDWGTTMLKETKGIDIKNGAWMLVYFEFAGLGGMLLTGWLTDRVCGGRAAPICVVCMLLAGGTIFLFWRAPPQAFWLNTALLMCTGFFIYGPQALAAVIVVKLATKRAAATAVGLTSIFGYASTVLSGLGLGALVQHLNWNWAFGELIAFAVIGALLFTAALPANVRNYSEPVPE